MNATNGLGGLASDRRASKVREAAWGLSIEPAPVGATMAPVGLEAPVEIAGDIPGDRDVEFNPVNIRSEAFFDVTALAAHAWENPRVTSLGIAQHAAGAAHALQ